MSALTPWPEPSLYRRLVDAGVKIDDHESDLYFEATSEALAVVRQYEAECVERLTQPPRTSLFVSRVDNRTWIEAPFMFQPWWDARRSR